MADNSKQFSKEDLDLIPDPVEPDNGEKTSEDAGDDPQADAAGRDAKDSDAEEGSVPKKKEDRRETIFDGPDDDGDDDDGAEKKDVQEEPDNKDAKDDSQPKDKGKEPELDWREDLVSLILKGKENELTASKLEKRREAIRRQLGRYKTPQDYMIAGFAAQDKLRSGEYRRAKLPDDATEEEIAGWRAENGVPAKAADYEVPKIPGHAWTEEDGPFIDSFKETAHLANMDQGQMNRVASWYAKNLADQQDAYLEKLAQQDKRDMEDLEDGLRSELGVAEFRPVSKRVQRFLKDQERGAGSFERKLREARFPDENGHPRRLLNDPDVTRFLIGLADETYGDSVLIMGDGRTDGANRITEIERIRDDNIDEYWRKGLDKEYADLIAKRDAASSRRRRSL